MIGKYLVNEQYILETSHWLITSPYEHEMTVNFINPASAVEVNQNGILVQLLRSNQMQSWFGRCRKAVRKGLTNVQIQRYNSLHVIQVSIMIEIAILKFMTASSNSSLAFIKK